MYLYFEYYSLFWFPPETISLPHASMRMLPSYLPTPTLQILSIIMLSLLFRQGEPPWVPHHPGTSSPRWTEHILPHRFTIRQSGYGEEIQWQATETETVLDLLVR